MNGQTVRVTCSHCKSPNLIPLDRCPTCDKPLPKPVERRAEPKRYTATIYVPRHWKSEPDAYAVTVLGDPGGQLVAISACGRSFSILERGTVVQDGQPFPSCFEAEPWMVPCRGELEASARGAS